jgi:osmotically-inducible protein OsmY
MRNSKGVVMVALMVLVTFGLACRSMSTATPDEVDPAAIEASIRSQILTTYPGETFDIGVSVSDAGVVTLTGTVDSEEKRTRLAEVARSVDGVERVVNELRVE